MEVNQLRYVCAIADTGNFSRAAERCRIAQPSLSQQVQKLEDDLGVKLFDRLGRSIRLTEAGRAFIPRARAILEQLDAARSSAADKNADLRGNVTVGVIPTVAPYLMPAYTASFAKKFPDAKLRIIEETTSVLVEGLRDLSIDVAILALPLRHKDLELFPIRTEPLFAVLKKNHPRARAKSLALTQPFNERLARHRFGKEVPSCASQPNSASTAATAWDSTPSASTWSERACPRLLIDRTIAACPELVGTGPFRAVAPKRRSLRELASV